ncbi:hypothetical protein LOAG_03385 [Loa loa]|uniref:Uncharacterized protein n=1 Tax=Loa loa TaxID=7209 RepID=A0A1S0U6H5_LOALO|nr:hypothetical protein LOAG_03385 [Loa loa]EFO25100.1 hypothetical protein LOAG_03385 [Loa loa]
MEILPEKLKVPIAPYCESLFKDITFPQDGKENLLTLLQTKGQSSRLWSAFAVKYDELLVNDGMDGRMIVFVVVVNTSHIVCKICGNCRSIASETFLDSMQ